MAHDTAYNFDPITPSQETRELYTNVGSSNFQLGLGARGFKGGTDLEIWDSAVAGTQLIENTDYEIVEVDTRNSPNAGFNIYTRVKVLNPAYQTGNIYITYKVVLSYVDAVFTNDTRSIAKSAGGKVIKYLTSADSPYTITDAESNNTFICDSSSGNINIVLPTQADNINEELEFIHQKGGNVLNVDGEGAEKINYLDSINMPAEGDRAKIYSSSVTSQWEFLDHNLQFYVKVCDGKTSGTNGGTFTSGAWRTRDLTTKDNDDQNIATLSANQITLQPGRYRIRAHAPAFRVNAHKARLEDITNTVTLIPGTNSESNSSSGGMSESQIKGEFEITSTTILEIQQRCATTKSLNGFGVLTGLGVIELYTCAEFWRIT